MYQRAVAKQCFFAMMSLSRLIGEQMALVNKPIFFPAAYFLFWLCLISRSAAASDLKLECDVQFEVENYLSKQTILKPSINLPASIPPGPSFHSYWIDIDFDHKVASVYDVPFSFMSAHPIEQYNSESSATTDPIILSKGNIDSIILRKGNNASSPTLATNTFYIRRQSGWFMRVTSIDVNKPSPDIIEVGVCGAGLKF